MVRSFRRMSILRMLLIGVALVGSSLAGLSSWWLGSPTSVLLVVSATIAGLIILTHATYGLYAVLIQFVVIGSSANVTLLEMAAFGLLAVVLGQALLALLRAPEIWWSARAWLAPLFTFLGWSVFNLLLALIQGVPLTSSLRELFPLTNYGLILAAYIWIRDRRQLKRLVVVVAGVVFLMMVRDLLYSVRLAFGLPLLEQLYQLLASTFSGGSFLFALLPLLLALALLGQRQGLLARLALVAVALSSVAVPLLSGTRTYWLGMLVALIIWELVRHRRRLLPRFVVYVLSGLLLILVGSLFLAYLGDIPLISGISVADRLATLDLRVLSDDWSFQGRVSETQAALREIARRPVLGRGLGFELTSNSRPWTGWEVTRGFLHNTYLHVLLKLGIIGLVAFIWFLVALGIRVWHIRNHCLSWEGRILAPVLLTALATLAFISLSTPHLNATHTVLVLSLLLGGTLGATRSQSNDNPHQKRGHEVSKLSDG